MVCNLSAQTFTTLHTFSQVICPPCAGNADGTRPYDSLVVSGDTLYGTTSGDGPSLYGTVFGVRTDGTEFANLLSFSGLGDGGEPYSGLLLSSNTLYGTT